MTSPPLDTGGGLLGGDEELTVGAEKFGVQSGVVIVYLKGVTVSCYLLEEEGWDKQDKI